MMVMLAISLIALGISALFYIYYEIVDIKNNKKNRKEK